MHGSPYGTMPISWDDCKVMMSFESWRLNRSLGPRRISPAVLEQSGAPALAPEAQRLSTSGQTFVQEGPKEDRDLPIGPKRPGWMDGPWTSLGIVLKLALAGLAVAALWACSGLPVNAAMIAIYAALLVATMAAIVTGFALSRRLGRGPGAFPRVLAVLSLYMAVPMAYFIFALLSWAEVSHQSVALSAATAVFGVLTARIGVSLPVSESTLFHRVLVYGIGKGARAVDKTLGSLKSNIKIVGFYPSPHEQAAEVPAGLVLPRSKSLRDAAQELRVNEIVVAVSERRGGAMPLRELLDCKLFGVRVLDLESYFEKRLGQIRLESLYAGWLIFGEGFRQGFRRTAVKRLFDLACSASLLVLAMPVMVLTAVLIALESGFPILYRQERVGLKGRHFNVVKFRSMRTDAEKDGMPRWASSNDDRVTRVGRIIRKLRIDELPQLFSVLKGDMSLVGPRPERPFFVDKLTREIPFYAVRHSVKPGVTGWAQVRYHYGATVEDSAEKLQFDLYYVKNHSLLLDVLILMETVGVVLTAKGAQ